jgi:hypothetical protein
VTSPKFAALDAIHPLQPAHRDLSLRLLSVLALDIDDDLLLEKGLEEAERGRTHPAHSNEHGVKVLMSA